MILLLVTGLIVGILIGATGVGGGSIVAPILILGFHMNPVIVVGTDLLYNIPTKLAAASLHYRQRSIDKGIATSLAIGGIVGIAAALIGLHAIAHTIDPIHLSAITKKAIGAAIIFAALILIVTHFVKPKASVEGAPKWIAALIGGAVAALATCTSIGAGAIAMPLLLLIYPRIAPKALVGADLLFSCVIAVLAAGAYALYIHPDIKVATLLAIGSLPGTWIGSKLSGIAGPWLKVIIAVVLFGTGLRMVL
jgi:uncharacterized membrane protein YfcA